MALIVWNGSRPKHKRKEKFRTCVLAAYPNQSDWGVSPLKPPENGERRLTPRASISTGKDFDQTPLGKEGLDDQNP